MPNRLAQESSPYLLQHADNPVDWYPWGQEAFERARREDKPIFLSVGYSTCHWCHVMAHESFEDPEVADFLNRHFVCIKVDREELPDVDEQYMLATQIMTGHGGWPNSVWLNHDLMPWYAGTYFPKEDRLGRPGFMNLLNQLTQAWQERRPEVEQQAERISNTIASIGVSDQAEKDPAPLDQALLDRAIGSFYKQFDSINGGFGTAPKFPPHGILSLLQAADRAGTDPQVSEMLQHTLRAMASGGIRDHLGGGFHRYSTDARWVLPHFEKMLYDNAQLFEIYAVAQARTPSSLYEGVLTDSFKWLNREMTHPQGAFFSALNADSEGEEGKFYVWSIGEIESLLGASDTARLQTLFNLRPEGNFREESGAHFTGSNVLHLSPGPKIGDSSDTGAPLKGSDADLSELKQRLLEARAARVRPSLDDKVLSGWNGLMIAALARAGHLLEQPQYSAAAERAGEFLLAEMKRGESHLFHTWRDGKAKIPGYLDDYAFVALGFLRLHEATGDAQWLRKAEELARTMIDEFWDAREGGFFLTSDEHDKLILRSKGLGGGGNTPDGNGVAAQVMIQLAQKLEDPLFARTAAETLRAFSTTMSTQPRAAESLLVALAAYLAAGDRLPPLAAPSGEAEGGGPVTPRLDLGQTRVQPGGGSRSKSD